MRRGGAWIACVGLVAVTAVVVTGDATPGRPDPYPLDSVLRLQDVQVLGTHNSYHERPDRPVLPLEPANYAHPPLNVQLAEEHVRSLEIDVFNEPKIPVMHSIMVDEQSNCPTLAACLRTVDAWSKANPGHLPVTLFIETKAIPTTTNRKTKRLIRQYATDHSLANWDGAGLARIEATVKRAFGRMLLTPDEVRGKRATLREAIVRDGWPTLRRTRGRVLVVLNAGRRLNGIYSKGAPSLQHKAMFVVSEPEDPSAAVISQDMPDQREFVSLVKDHFLVRTRSDAEGVEARADNLQRATTALDSGATIVATDYPVPDPDDRQVRGRPARQGRGPVQPDHRAEAVPQRLAREPGRPAPAVRSAFVPQPTRRLRS